MPPLYDIVIAVLLGLLAYPCYVMAMKAQDGIEDYLDGSPDPNTTRIPTQRKRYGWICLGLLLSAGGWVLVWLGVGFGKFLVVYDGLSTLPNWLAVPLAVLTGVSVPGLMMGIGAAWFVAFRPVFHGRASYDNFVSGRPSYRYIKTSDIRFARNASKPWVFFNDRHWLSRLLFPWINPLPKGLISEARR
jgi:hypothetical protein